jgi:hypothetical protein
MTHWLRTYDIDWAIRSFDCAVDITNLTYEAGSWLVAGPGRNLSAQSDTH